MSGTASAAAYWQVPAHHNYGVQRPRNTEHCLTRNPSSGEQLQPYHQQLTVRMQYTYEAQGNLLHGETTGSRSHMQTVVTAGLCLSAARQTFPPVCTQEPVYNARCL